MDTGSSLSVTDRDNPVRDIADIIVRHVPDLGVEAYTALMTDLVIYINGRDLRIFDHAYKLGVDVGKPDTTRSDAIAPHEHDHTYIS